MDRLDVVQIKFLDSIVTPWRKLNSLLSEHPLCLNPDSNVLIANTQSLVVALNHFREKNQYTDVSSILINDDIRNLANSYKHMKGAETAVSCRFTPMYECADEKFRFIKNDIVCKYESAQGLNKDRVFSAPDKIWNSIQDYARKLKIDISQYAPQESNYSFLPVAISFSRPEYGAYTISNEIKMLRKSADIYEPYACPNVKFVVLGEEALGSDLSKMNWDFVEA